MKNYPRFAVVGHPNKGKSTIVSALALNKSVEIGNTPGLTKLTKSFPLKIDNKIIYEIIDTPGFQRARGVLEWFKSQPSLSAHKKHQIVNDFINENINNPDFRDEIELLKVIMDGAVIIYVVDASKPYGSEYETEMEILRWTGQASMALLNLIGDNNYSKEWEQALGFYFRMIRKFNPMEMNFYSHIFLFESMSQLKEDWIEPIKYAISILEKDYFDTINQTIEIISEYNIKMLSYIYKEKVTGKKPIKEQKQNLIKKYKSKLYQFEFEEERKIEEIWKHMDILRNQDIMEFKESLIYPKENRFILGLKKKVFTGIGGSSGFILGSIVGSFFGITTALIIAPLGLIFGGIGVVYGFDFIFNKKYLGEKEISCGPIEDLNLSKIITFRAINYAYIIIKYSHALRDIKLPNRDMSIEMLKDKSLNIKSILQINEYIKYKKYINLSLMESYKENIKNILINLLKNKESGKNCKL